MKRIVLLITLLSFIVCNSKAQKEKDIIIYKNGDISYRSTLTSSDNIKFTKPESSMVFNHVQNGNVVKQINVSDIDSICFKTYTEGESVLINSVRWATRNVGAPHTFVTNPEDFGEYYQWNRGITDFYMEGEAYHNSAYAKSDTWLPENDPCPAGYRVPRIVEPGLPTVWHWTDRYGVLGFEAVGNNIGNSVFIPSAGSYSSPNGTSYEYTSGIACYWLGTNGGSTAAYAQHTGGPGYYDLILVVIPRSTPCSVRCVAK